MSNSDAVEAFLKATKEQGCPTVNSKLDLPLPLLVVNASGMVIVSILRRFLLTPDTTYQPNPSLMSTSISKTMQVRT